MATERGYKSTAMLEALGARELERVRRRLSLRGVGGLLRWATIRARRGQWAPLQAAALVLEDHFSAERLRAFELGTLAVLDSGGTVNA